MFQILAPLKTAIASLLLSASLFFSGGQPANLGAIQPVADYRSSLTSGITSSATSFTVVATSTASGEYLTQGAVYGLKIGGREYVIGTLSAGKQFTSVTRGISLITGTTTGGVAESWGRGTAVEITDAPILLQISNKISGTEYFDRNLTYASNYSVASTSNVLAPAWFVQGFADTASSSVKNFMLGNANTWLGVNTFSAKPVFSIVPTSAQAPSVGNDLANKTYVDGVALAGAPNADTTTKGVVEQATDAEVIAGTTAGGTGANLFINPSSFQPAFNSSMASLIYSTTSAQQLATTTIPLGVLQGKNNFSITFYTPEIVGTGSSTAVTRMSFNADLSLKYGYQYQIDTTQAGADNTSGAEIVTSSTIKNTQRYANINLFNGTTTPKMGSYNGYIIATSTGATVRRQAGVFHYDVATSRASSIQFWLDATGALFATSTQIIIQAY